MIFKKKKKKSSIRIARKLNIESFSKVEKAHFNAKKALKG